MPKHSKSEPAPAAAATATTTATATATAAGAEAEGEAEGPEIGHDDDGHGSKARSKQNAVSSARLFTVSCLVVSPNLLYGLEGFKPSSCKYRWAAIRRSATRIAEENGLDFASDEFYVLERLVLIALRFIVSHSFVMDEHAFCALFDCVCDDLISMSHATIIDLIPKTELSQQTSARGGKKRKRDEVLLQNDQERAAQKRRLDFQSRSEEREGAMAEVTCGSLSASQLSGLVPEPDQLAAPAPTSSSLLSHMPPAQAITQAHPLSCSPTQALPEPNTMCTSLNGQETEFAPANGATHAPTSRITFQHGNEETAAQDFRSVASTFSLGDTTPSNNGLRNRPACFWAGIDDPMPEGGWPDNDDVPDFSVPLWGDPIVPTSMPAAVNTQTGSSLQPGDSSGAEFSASHQPVASALHDGLIPSLFAPHPTPFGHAQQLSLAPSYAASSEIAAQHFTQPHAPGPIPDRWTDDPAALEPLLDGVRSLPYGHDPDAQEPLNYEWALQNELRLDCSKVTIESGPERHDFAPPIVCPPTGHASSLPDAPMNIPSSPERGSDMPPSSPSGSSIDLGARDGSPFTDFSAPTSPAIPKLPSISRPASPSTTTLPHPSQADDQSVQAAQVDREDGSNLRRSSRRPPSDRAEPPAGPVSRERAKPRSKAKAKTPANRTSTVAAKDKRNAAAVPAASRAVSIISGTTAPYLPISGLPRDWALFRMPKLVEMCVDRPPETIYGVRGWLAASNLRSANLCITDETLINSDFVYFERCRLAPWYTPRSHDEFIEMKQTTERVLEHLAYPIVLRGSPDFQPPSYINTAGEPASRFEHIVLQQRGDPESLVEVQVVDAYHGEATDSTPSHAPALFTGRDCLTDWQLNRLAVDNRESRDGHDTLYTVTRRQFIQFGRTIGTGGIYNLSGTTTTLLGEWLRSSTIDFSMDHNTIAGEMEQQLEPLRHSEFNFEINALAGAYTTQKVSANGLGTYAKIEHGQKIWIIKTPNALSCSPSTSRSSSQDIRSLSANEYDLYAILLNAGDVLIMPPGTLFEVLTTEDTVATGGYFLSNTTLRETMVTSLRLRGGWRKLTDAKPGASVLAVVAKHVMRVLLPVAEDLRHLDAHKEAMDSSADLLAKSPYLTGQVISEWVVCILFGDHIFGLPDEFSGDFKLYERALTRAALFIRWIDLVKPDERYLEVVYKTALAVFTTAALGCELATELKAGDIRQIINEHLAATIPSL